MLSSDALGELRGRRFISENLLDERKCPRDFLETITLENKELKVDSADLNFFTVRACSVC